MGFHDLVRFPASWNQLAEKESHQINNLEQILVAKVFNFCGIWSQWSNVAPPETSVPAEIEALARNFLRDAGVSSDLGFVILHRRGESFYFLLVSTWRNENELWETIYAKASAAETGFKLFTFDSSHRGTFCVWELGVVWHEQQVWKRFLISKRAPEEVAHYLDDRYEGPV